MLLVDFPNEETVLERHIYEPNNKQRESSKREFTNVEQLLVYS